MAAPVWPASLPQNFQIASYAETMPALIARTNMDMGPAKVRRRLTNNVRPIKTAMKLTDSQYVALISFWQSDCEGGALAFTWNVKDPALVQLYPSLVVDVPNGIVQLTLRFVAPPSRKVLTGADSVATQSGVSEVDLQLEVMP